MILSINGFKFYSLRLSQFCIVLQSSFHQSVDLALKLPIFTTVEGDQSEDLHGLNKMFQVYHEFYLE